MSVWHVCVFALVSVLIALPIVHTCLCMRVACVQVLVNNFSLIYITFPAQGWEKKISSLRPTAMSGAPNTGRYWFTPVLAEMLDNNCSFSEVYFMPTDQIAADFQDCCKVIFSILFSLLLNVKKSSLFSTIRIQRETENPYISEAETRDWMDISLWKWLIENYG